VCGVRVEWLVASDENSKWTSFDWDGSTPDTKSEEKEGEEKHQGGRAMAMKESRSVGLSKVMELFPSIRNAMVFVLEGGLGLREIR
jgi:hypothetical protein